MATNISPGYEDIISKSVLICKGPPAVYKLKPTVEMFGTQTRKTVGKKNVEKMNKTILLVGETGTGKSTLINALFNYIIGVKFEDELWFQIVEEEGKSQTDSQTSDVMVYEIFGFEDETLPFSLTIIDTPGFGDTVNREHDALIGQRLYDLFSSNDGVHEIHAVGLVMKASENRLTDRLMYIFNSVASLFGKGMEKCIVALITHSDGLSPENALNALETAKITLAKNEENEPIYFQFNNRQEKNRAVKLKEKKKMEFAFEMSQEELRDLATFLKTCAPQKLQKSVSVLKERIRLAACIQNLQERIKLTELKQREIQQTKEALRRYEEEMKKNENFIIEVDEVYKDKEDIDGGMWALLMYHGAVCCTHCQENCHHPGCTMAWYPKDCEVMKKGKCTVCSGKCPASSHVKEKWIYVTKTKKVLKNEEDLKEKYEKNKSEHENKSSLLENLEKEIEELSAERSKLVDKAYSHFVKLEEIAMNVDSVSTYVHLDFLIEKMKEKGETKLKKLKDIQSRISHGTQKAAQYMWLKLTTIEKH